MKAIDRTNIYNKFKGLWVAIREEDQETVVGSGKTLRQALDEAHKNGFANPIMEHVPSKLMTSIGGIFL